LENFIERSVILSRSEVLQIPLTELRNAPAAGSQTLEECEREHILKVLRSCHGVVGGANGCAAHLGLKRTTLNARLRKLGISRRDL